MSRRNLMLGLGVVILGAIVAGFVMRLLSAPPADRMLVAGDVRSVVRTISAPALSYPTVTYSVTVPSNAAAGANTLTLSETVYGGPQASATTSRTQGIPVVSGRLVEVNVQVGDHVTTGTVLARFDTTALDQGVEAARLQAGKTKTQVAVIKNGIDTILNNQDKIATGKDQLATAKAQLAKAKAQLAAAKKQLLDAQKKLLEAKKNRAQLEATLAQLKQQAAQFPPGQVPAKLQQSIKDLTILLASIDPGLAKISAGLKQIATGEAKLKAAEAKLATGAAQLATATDALSTAKKQAVKARDFVQIIADNANVGIVLAEAKRAQATLVSPYSGVVTQAPAVGQVMIVGAPVVRIRPDDPVLVDAYLTGDQLTRVRAGQKADITYDSSGGKVLLGTLATIGSDAQYPPTSYPTDIVHMTRTVRVTFRLDAGDQPPAGTPVDIAIHLN